MIDVKEYTRRLEGFLVSQGWEKLDAPMEAGPEADEAHYYISMEIVGANGTNFDSYYWTPAVDALRDVLLQSSLKHYYRADVFYTDKTRLTVNIQATELPTISELQAMMK